MMRGEITARENQLRRTDVRPRRPKAARRADGLYEIKLDGYRCLAGKDASGVSLWLRRGNALTLQFPAIAKACDLLPTGTFVDGEIVATDSKEKFRSIRSSVTAPAD